MALRDRQLCAKSGPQASYSAVILKGPLYMYKHFTDDF